MKRRDRLASITAATPLRYLIGFFVLFSMGQAAAVPVSFEKATFNSFTNYSSMLGGKLSQGPERTELNLHNGAADKGRITNVFIHDLTGALAETPATATLILENIGPNKVGVIKAVRALTGLGLKEAKDLVESAPVEILVAGPFTEVQDAQASLDATGAITSLDVDGIFPVVELDALLASDVVLESFGANKVGVIKAVRALTGLGLKEAKDLVESVPVVVEISGQDPEAAKMALEDAGASVSINEIEVGLEILTDGISVPQDIAPENQVITLESFGANKVGVIKAVRALTGLGLKEAKDLVESVPAEIDVIGITAAEARAILEDAGAIVSIDGPLNPPLMDPDYQLLLDYKGEDTNPDLLFLFGLEIEFDALLALIGLGEFVFGVEFTDSTGSDLYLTSAAQPDVSAVPIPPMALPMALCLILIGLFQRKARR